MKFIDKSIKNQEISFYLKRQDMYSEIGIILKIAVVSSLIIKHTIHCTGTRHLQIHISIRYGFRYLSSKFNLQFF